MNTWVKNAAICLLAGWAAREGLAQPLPVIYTGQPAPFGGNAATWANAITLSASSGGGYAAFRARATGGTTTLGVNDAALLRTGPRPADPTLLLAVSASAITGNGFPAGASWLVDLTSPAAVTDDGSAAALLRMTGPGITAANDTVVARFDAGGAATQLLRFGGAAPGLPGQTVTGVTSIGGGRPGEFVVLGTTNVGQAVWRFGPSGASLVYSQGQLIATQTGGTVTGGVVDGMTVDDTGAVALFLNAGGFSVAVDDASGSPLRLWVQPNVTPVPEIGAGVVVQSWGGATLEGGTLCYWASFTGGGTTASPGIVRATTGGTAASVLVRPPVAVPELGPSAQISTIFSPASYDPDGGTLFRATVTGSSFGASLSTIWYIPPAWLGHGSSPQLLFRQGQTITVDGAPRTISSTAEFNNSVSRDGRVLAVARLTHPGAGTLDQCVLGGVPASGLVPLITQSATYTLPNATSVVLGSTASTPRALDDRGRAWVTNYPPASTLGLSIAAPGSCGLADVGSTGGVPGPDGQLDNNDFVVYIDLFFTSQSRADLGKVGGVYGRDGQWDNNDFIVYIDAFFNGCG